MKDSIAQVADNLASRTWKHTLEVLTTLEEEHPLVNLFAPEQISEDEPTPSGEVNPLVPLWEPEKISEGEYTPSEASVPLEITYRPAEPNVIHAADIILPTQEATENQPPTTPPQSPPPAAESEPEESDYESDPFYYTEAGQALYKDTLDSDDCTLVERLQHDLTLATSAPLAQETWDDYFTRQLGMQEISEY